MVDGSSHPPVLSAPADRKLVRLGVMRSWPEGMQARVGHVWRDLAGFTIDYKLYDLQRVLAEFGFELELYERNAGVSESRHETFSPKVPDAQR
jgi:hypothetical protein